MKDPYSVLGVNRNATDEQIKDAYRLLAKKYHPDNYQDNPLSDLAGEKMREINDAYDEIMSSRRGKKGQSGSDYTNTSSAFPEIRSLIAENRLEQAQELLDGVPINRRNAEWYYLNGTVLYNRGWFDQAYTSFATACRMDPSNGEYRSALNRVQGQANANYNNPYRSYGAPATCCLGANSCDCCSNLLCADCLCECMGGDLIPCC